MSDALPPRQQAFLDMLASRAKAAGSEPAPAPPGAPEDTGTETGGAPAAPSLPAADAPPSDPVFAPASYDWQDDPQATARVQAAVDAPIMDLGADAQAQGTAMALQTIAAKLGSVIQDLSVLHYDDEAEDAADILEWAIGEHDRLYGELEQRGRDRRGEG